MSRLHAGGIHRRYILTPLRFRAVRDLLVAADRIRDQWADSDDAVKRRLWIDLHTKADAVRETLG
jgi:hypothetical protein